MKIGLIGLGKMGGNLALNMKDQGFEVVVYNRDSEKVKNFVTEGIEGAYSYEEFFEKLDDRSIVWLMVSAGQAVDDIIEKLMYHLKSGDIVIDGGNSKYTDSIRRANKLMTEEVHFMDVGTSGGIAGARNGACMMIGGNKDAFKSVEDLFKALCVEDGYAYIGESGSGHYVKMIHNGIEYGMMQAIGEGFEILKEGPFEVDNYEVAKVWSNGSIIESYLVEMAMKAFEHNKTLKGVLDIVDSSGEGLWTVEESLRLKLPSYVITSSLMKRFESKQEDRFSNKVVAALRNEFGGHKLHKL